MRYVLSVLFLYMCAWAGPASGAEPEQPVLTVLFTGEAHGALLPCNCPLQPLGGVARRATLIKRYRARGPVLVVDAGNWAAGGIYDEDANGDTARDRLRTELMAQAMTLMGYDHVAWAEFDRVWLDKSEEGKLPEVFASLKPPVAKLLESFQENRWTHLLTNNAQISSFWKHPKYEGNFEKPPTKLSDEAKPPSGDFHVVLYPFGEEASTEFARKNPEISLVINGGRKSTIRTSWTVGATMIANFEFQAQKLGVAEVFLRKDWKEGDPGSKFDVRVHFEALTAEIPDDPEIAKLLAPHLEVLKARGKKAVEVEFFTLPECPYCPDAYPAVEKLVADLGNRVNFSVHFMVDKEKDGKFSAMHGERELAEARIQALVAKYYPERLFEWLRWRAKNRDASWEKGVEALSLLKARFTGAIAAGEPDELLERDYQLSLRRRVGGTPTLMIAGRIYEDPSGFQREKVLRVLCGLLAETKPAVCATVPACFTDTDCRKRGFIGRCIEPGSPQAHCDTSRAAVKVPGVVLVEPKPIWTNHERHIEIIAGYLPGIEWREVDPGSAEGQALVAKLGPARFPAYLIDPVAKTEYDFEHLLKPFVEEQAGWLLVRAQVTGANRLAARPRIPGRVDLFVSRFSKNGQEALATLLEFVSKLPPERRDAFRVHDALYLQDTEGPDGKSVPQLAAKFGKAELEDAAIALSVKRLAPEKYFDYLRERGKRRGSLYWDRAVEAVGLDPAKVRALAEDPAPEILKDLKAEAALLEAFESRGEIVFCAENCEVVQIESHTELLYYLELLAARAPKNK